MVHLYDAIGVDQNVSTHLKDVLSGRPSVSGQNLQNVFEDRNWSDQFPQPGSLKTVGLIEHWIFVMQHRPLQASPLDVLLSHFGRIKSDNFDVDPQGLKIGVGLSQLRQVNATRRSAQMPMKHQQQPAACRIFERMRRSVSILDRKRNCLLIFF